MEKRDYCINYVKGICEMKENCKFAHIIVEDKEIFLKLHESRKAYNNGMKPEADPFFQPSFNAVPTKSGNNKILSKCQGCGKGFVFDEKEISKGELRSITCFNCLALGF